MQFYPTTLAGDPDLIAEKARTYKNLAQRLTRAADNLADLTDDDTFISLAVDEVRLKALDARASTERMSVRYDGAADALAQYAIDLQAAQDRAQRAADAYNGANGQTSAAQRAMDDAQDAVNANPNQPALVQVFLAAQAQYSSLVNSAATARAEHDAAIADKDAAARRAGQGIGQAMADAGLQDNFFEAIGGDLQEFYEWAQVVLGPIIEEIYKALQVISSILNVIALIVSIASIFLPFLAPLAAALQTVALVLSVLVFACSLALFLLGRQSLGGMLMDGLGMALNIFTAGAGGTALKSALGAAPEAVVAMQNGAMTAGGQLHNLVTFGPTVIQLVASDAALIVDGGELILGEAIELVPDFGPDNVDLAPSAAGPTWNAPPTPQVESVFTVTPDFASVDLVLPEFESFASVSLAEPIGVTASA